LDTELKLASILILRRLVFAIRFVFIILLTRPAECAHQVQATKKRGDSDEQKIQIAGFVSESYRY